MRELFDPRAVAVIGASRDLGKWGGRVVHNLVRFGYRGSLHPVNPFAPIIEGIQCVPAVRSLPEAIDLAIVALPAEATVSAVTDLALKRVRVGVVLTSGFAELGEGGKALQAQLVRVAKEGQVRLIGPNSLGVINARISMVASATSAAEVGLVLRGGLSVVSQSGAVGLGTMLTRAADRGIGFAKLVSTGNESDLSTAELVAYLADDDETTAIAIFIEGISDGRALLESITAAGERGKPVAVLKVGRSARGASAAETHTGRLAGAPEVFRGAMAAAGAIWCTDLEDLLDKTLVAREQLALDDAPRLVVASSSGGINTLAADIMEDAGIRLTSLSSATQTKLAAQLPAFNRVANPLDISGHVAIRAEVQHACLKILCEDPSVDGIILVMTFLPTYPQLVRLLQDDPLPARTLVCFVNCGGSVAADAAVSIQRDLGYPVFASLSGCIHAVADMWRHTRWRSRHVTGPRSGVGEASARNPAALAAGGLDDCALIELLEGYGLRYVPWRTVSDPDEAALAAAELGFPVALKALSTDLPHKSEVGAVRLGLEAPDEVRSAFVSVQGAVRIAGGKGVVLLLQRQINGGLELIVGGKYDPQFGPVVTLGHGGVLAELLARSVTRPAPLDEAEAEAMLAELPSAEILDGYRDVPARDTIALRRTIVATSRLVADLGSVVGPFELDLNPVLVMPESGGTYLVDSLFTRTDGDKE